jgi:hypothetical protein
MSMGFLPLPPRVRVGVRVRHSDLQIARLASRRFTDTSRITLNPAPEREEKALRKSDIHSRLPAHPHPNPLPGREREQRP